MYCSYFRASRKLFLIVVVCDRGSELTTFNSSTNFDSMPLIPFSLSSGDYRGLENHTYVEIFPGDLFVIYFADVAEEYTVMEVTLFIGNASEVEVTVYFDNFDHETVRNLRN